MNKEAGSVRSDTGPFAMVPEWLLDPDGDGKSVSGNGVKLYAILSRYADSEEKRATPRRRTLAKRMNCSVDTVDRTMNELEKFGAILREERFDEDAEAGTARQTTNAVTVYRMRQPVGKSAEGSLSADTQPPLGKDAQPRTRVSLNENQLNENRLAAVPAAGEYDPLKGAKINERNIPWDALVEVTQADEKVDAGVLSKSLKQIRGFVVSASSPQTFFDPRSGETHIANQIRARARLYRQRWPNMELTPPALAKHWARVTTEPPAPDKRVSDLDRDYARMLGEQQQ